jgi:hypothetical protein
VQALLQTIPTLNAIIGSPVPLTVKQAQAATLEVLAAVFGWELPRDASALLALLNAATTGGVVFRRTREGVARSNPSDLAFEDSLADLAALVLRIAGVGQQARSFSPARPRRYRKRLPPVGQEAGGLTRSDEPRLQEPYGAAAGHRSACATPVRRADVRDRCRAP